MKVASIPVPQAKPLYPCLLHEKTLFSLDGSTTTLSCTHKVESSCVVSRACWALEYFGFYK